MSIKSRIKQIEQKSGIDRTGTNCRCRAPYRKIPDSDCKNCGKEFDEFSFKPGIPIEVIKPRSEGYEY